MLKNMITVPLSFREPEDMPHEPVRTILIKNPLDMEREELEATIAMFQAALRERYP